ncbi:MAG: hypothetical protein ACYSWO_22280 [Planctomycetota bacterium]|jgi:hypothetical protein
MKVCRIQDTSNQVGKAGAVAWGVYADYPGEAETIMLGFAPSKAYDSTGIGRQGNFMLWGWSAEPSRMTPAGRKLFLNCISYIHKFDKKPFVAIPQRAMTRDQDLMMILGRIEHWPWYAERSLPRDFPPEIASRYGNDLSGMRKYYEENIEWVYAAGGKFSVDQDLKSLGIDSNRKVTTIGALIELLAEESKAALARECLKRYTKQTFTSARAWNKWYEENAGHLIFSDRGGYCFYKVLELN